MSLASLMSPVSPGSKVAPVATPSPADPQPQQAKAEAHPFAELLRQNRLAAAAHAPTAPVAVTADRDAPSTPSSHDGTASEPAGCDAGQRRTPRRSGSQEQDGR